MTSLTLSRLAIFALIACALLFLIADQIQDPFLHKDANYSSAPFTRGKQKIDPTTRTRLEQA